MSDELTREKLSKSDKISQTRSYSFQRYNKLMLFGTHEAIKIYKIYLPFIKLLHFRIAYEIRVIHFHLYLFLGAV